MNRKLFASLSSAPLKKAQLLAILAVALLVASCSNQPAGTPIPTRTQIPTFAYVSPTPVAQVATAIATQAAIQVSTEEASALDPAAIEAGLGRYTALECASCHGENGVGGDAPALVGITMSQDDFLTYMRNGGPLGTAHQYQSNRLSDRGAANLYIYLKSLS